jgi:hypothetical protein
MFARKRGGAWDCERCPKDSAICPAWAELIETHIRTAEERVTKECIFRMLPRMMIEVIKASNRPAAEMGQLRAELYEGFQVMGRSVLSLPPERRG